MTTHGALEQHLAKGNQYIADGDSRRARMCFARAVEVAPRSAAALDGLAWTYYLDGDHARAKTLLERAIHCEPAFAEAYTDLGCVLHELGEFKEAERLHKHCLRLQPDRHDAHFNLGLLYIRLQRYRAAEHALVLATQCVPPQPDSFQALGEVKLLQEDFAGACVVLEACLALDADNIEADLLLTYARYEQRGAAPKKPRRGRPRRAKK
ncbi:MAG: tetratricopeptide repeat protein [bacterium]|nr:tetratricopeptide repeat protein [bacterium]